MSQWLCPKQATVRRWKPLLPKCILSQREVNSGIRGTFGALPNHYVMFRFKSEVRGAKWCLEEHVNTVIPELPETLCKLWCLVSSSRHNSVPRLDPSVEHCINKLREIFWLKEWVTLCSIMIKEAKLESQYSRGFLFLFFFFVVTPHKLSETSWN